MQSISSRLLELVMRFEKFESKSYICPAGLKTIGYGHVILSNESFTTITEAQASELLKSDLSIAQKLININVKINLNENQLDALTSLVFNWGSGNFLKSKGLKYLNANDIENAKIQFFSKDHGVVNINSKFSNGLYRRRQEELNIFNS